MSSALPWPISIVEVLQDWGFSSDLSWLGPFPEQGNILSRYINVSTAKGTGSCGHTYTHTHENRLLLTLEFHQMIPMVTSSKNPTKKQTALSCTHALDSSLKMQRSFSSGENLICDSLSRLSVYEMEILLLIYYFRTKQNWEQVPNSECPWKVATVCKFLSFYHSFCHCIRNVVIR